MLFFKKRESNNKKRLDEATKLLVEDEKRFHDIFDQSAVGESIVGLDGRWLDVNNRLCKMLGYSRREMLSRNFSDVTYPEDVEKSQQVRRDIIAGKIPNAELEKRYIKKDGSIVWVLLSISLFRNHDHKPHYFITHTQDITSFKKIEEQLRSSQEKFVSIFQLSPNAIAITDFDDGRIVDVNDNFCKMFGYSRSELIGRTTKELNIWVNPSDRDVFVSKIKGFGEIYNFETTLRRKDGALLSVIDAIRGIKINGEDCAISIIHDITARKNREKDKDEAEEKYRTIVEGVNDGIVIIQDFLTKFANAKMLEITGYTMQEIQERPFLHFVAPEYVELVKDNYEKRLAGKQTEQRYQVQIIKKDGTQFSVEISGSFVNYGGKPADMIFLTDITERKKREEEVLQYKFIIEQSNQQIGIANLDSNMIFVNKAMAEAHGYKAEDLIGKSFFMFHPKEEHEKVENDVQILREKGRHSYEVLQLRKDGSTYDSFMDNFVLNIDSKPKYIIGMAVDISEFKKAEREIVEQKSLLDSIVKSTNDGLLVISTEGKVEFYNDKFIELWKIPESLIKEKDDRKLLDYVVGQLSDPKKFTDRVGYLYAHPEQEDYDTVDFTDGRVFDRFSTPQKIGKNIVGRIWSFTDVTEKIKNAKKEKDRVEQIERMNKLAVGRELKMIELKKEIENLKKKD